MSILDGVLLGGIVTLVVQLVKNYIKPRFGDTGILAFLIALSAVVGFAVSGFKLLPADWQTLTLNSLVYASALYSLILKRLE